MFAVIGAWFAKSVILSRIGGFLKMIPKQVWIALAVIATLLLAFHVHQVKTRAFAKAQYNAGYQQAMKDVEAKAIKIKKAADALNEKVAQLERSKNDAEATRINHTADALSLRGPGAARCVSVGHPGMASSPSGHGSPSGNPGPAPAPVPQSDGSDDLTAVRWTWLVNTGRQCDLDRAEALSWRSWWQSIAKRWPGHQ